MTVRSADDADELRVALEASDRDIELGDVHRGDDGFVSYRFRYLLPLAVEIQYFPV